MGLFSKDKPETATVLGKPLKWCRAGLQTRRR